ncbi:hypothetical protein F441_10788 [Phytophthora nicotianae CJ01A1]|uniref:Uncharacterized protein n=5 Tax=Phytophthora nicotianae TaxID=4792 RepID=V9F126_PHYNI|nr:hypothetical protein F443_10863 [Phytophthora nicotianae P1569]ETK84442.1 hypothetical protein L915_10598 [Phytophthora nicotianae]ETO73116.1 hypothetical protein F444_10923 [Phytophthora nicotianae P1976]ETP14267.1 hypothetical protein F441_10788 [Phytophthora nicotianae CJ01A1]ETP42327.1 hypothetical protein F442_10765 [Phytophthora nicotianae P10297]
MMFWSPGICSVEHVKECRNSVKEINLFYIRDTG